MWYKAAVILSLLSQISDAKLVPDDLVITLPDGTIQGTTYTSGNKTYYGFQGIPYATPPTGDLRLESPQPAQPWTGILDATKDRTICSSGLGPDEGEDCLYINVYVPDVEANEKLPVLFWIYGGSFTGGSSRKSQYGPDYLIKEDVIVVSFNYRLGPLGFLSTGDAVLPGNLGLKDQVLALKWTHQNIELFGGDPEKVTIFGQSAGATSIGLHLISKKSAGLFRGAILESGSGLVHWSVDWQAREIAYLIADAIPGGDYGNDTQALKDFLKNSTLEQIVAAFQALPGGIHPAPTIEVESEDAFITQSHYELLVKGDFNKVPIIIGLCSEESLSIFGNLDNAKKSAQGYDNAPTTIIAEDLRPNASNVDEVVKNIQGIYLKEGEKFETNLVGVAKYYTDNRYARGILKHAELTSEFAPVYLYEFSYYGGRANPPAYIDGAERVGHSGELAYLFYAGNPSQADEDVLTQNRLVKLWTNFAKYLNPTPESSELLGNVTWVTASRGNLQYLSINNTLEVRPSLKKVAYDKWNGIYETYGTKPFITF